MIKPNNRRSALRARASALAVMTGIALIVQQQKAMAAFAIDPAYNATSCVLNVNSSTVSADGFGRSIIVQNNGFLGETAKPGLIVNGSTLSGSFVNQGNVTFGPPGCSNSGGSTVLTFSGGPAAAEFKNSTVTGGVYNTGTIDSTQNGIAFEETGIGVSTNAPSVIVFQNESSITAGSRAVSMVSGSVYGTIANITGYIEGGSGAGIHLENMTATGGLENTGIVKSVSSDAIYITDTTIGGRIYNDKFGQIIGSPNGGAGVSFAGNVTITSGLQNEGRISGYTGVRFFNPSFSGDIVNRGDGQIVGTIDGMSGLALNFSGELRNEDKGVIEGLFGFGINLASPFPSSGSFVGDIYNGPAARISGDQGGIALDFATIETNFDNQGLIEMTGSGSTPLFLSGGAAAWFNANVEHTGTYKNSGTIDGTSRSGAGGLVITGGDVNADIVNVSGGEISGSNSAGGVGILVGANALNGNVYNSGIVNGDVGISIGPNPLAIATLSGSGGINITGDVTNSGSVNGNIVGVSVFANEWTGNFLNDAGATIVAPDGQGISITAVTLTGDVTNNGSVSDGALISLTEWNGDFTTGLDSNISNQNGTGLLIGSGDIGEIGSLAASDLIWIGDVTNNGVVSGATNGASVSLDSFSGSFVNNGTFSGSSGTGLSIFANTWNGDWTNSTLSTIRGGTTGALLNVGQFTGDAVNNGRIAGGGVDTGWHIVADNFTGKIENNDILEAAGNALHVEITTMSGSVINNATIEGGANLSIAEWTGNFTTNATSQITNANGVALQIGGREIDTFSILAADSNLVWTGDFNSAGTLSGSTGGLRLSVDQFNGSWTNSGQISGGTGSASGPGVGVAIYANTWTGDWTNATGASITGDATGVYFEANSIDGNVLNQGSISGAQFNTGLHIVANSMSGSVTNTGSLSAPGNALHLEIGDFTGDIDNQNLIQGGANLAFNTLTGDVKNALGAQIVNTNGDGLRIGSLPQSASVIGQELGAGLVWNGDFDNKGEISGTNGDGGNIFVGSFSGSFVNAGSITGSAASFSAAGLYVSAGSWTGDFTNQTGASISGSATGFYFAADQATGTFKNLGTISGGASTTGWHIVANTFTGDVVNGTSGVLQAPSLALHLEIDNLIGDVLNDGLIQATASNGVAALLKSNGGSGSYAGQVVNTGTIEGSMASGSGLRIETYVEDGVLNEGTLRGKTAYDTTNAAGATVFVQQGANSQVDGDMRLSLSYADDVTFKGGQLKGSIFGGEGDDDVTVDVASGSFAFNGNTVTDIDAFTAKSGTTLLGALAFGTDGLGMTMNSQSLTVKSGASLFLDDNTVVNTAGLDLESGSTLTYFLTTNVNQHGVINVADPQLLNVNAINALALAGTANVAGTIQAFFSNTGSFTNTSYLYSGVIESTGGVNGAFDAVAFAPGGQQLGAQFELSALYNGDSVDLLLSRTPFDELIEDPSANQQEVGGALEEICADAPAGSELADFCNYVGLLDEEEIPNAFEEVSGSRFPQLAGLGLDLTELLTMPSNENNVHGTAFGTCQQAGFGWCGTQQYAALASPGQATDAMTDEDPFAWLRPGKREVGRNGAWGRYVGNWRNVDGDFNARGLRAQTNGFAGGVDHVFAEDLMVGVAGLYADTTSKFSKAPADKGDITTYQAGVYASWGDADFYVNANSTLIWNDFETRRRIQTGPSTFAFADGEFDGFGGSAFVELGTVIEEDGFRFQPLASIFYMTHTTGEFTETGALGLDLVVREATTESLRSQVGARLAHPLKWGETRIVPEIRAAWRHEFLDVRQDSNVNFALVPLAADMKIVGSESSRDMAVLGFGLSASLGRNTVLYSDVDGAFNDDKTSLQASIGLRHSW